MSIDGKATIGAHLLRPPRHFDDLLGKANAVEGLRNRVRGNTNRTGIILHGPAGVGKRTLARIYAKAIQCQTPTSDGSPCNQCQTCLSIDNETSFGNMEVDAAMVQDTGTVAKELFEKVRYASLADRRVITLANADLFSPRAFDTLLKSLEEMRADVSFIFTATNLKSMRLAGQSRCINYRVRPLAPTEARRYLDAYGDVHKIDCDDRVLDIIVAYAKGFPGELRRACDIVFGSGWATLETTRTALGLDWVEDMAATCQVFLANPRPIEFKRNADDEVDVVEQVRRLRVFLQYVYVQGLHHLPEDGLISDPAFLHLESDVLAKSVAALRERAKGNSSVALWRELATNVLSNDHEGIHVPLAVWESGESVGAPTVN